MLRPLIRRQRALLPAILETMEPRQLLTFIMGTPGDDHIVIAFSDTVGQIIVVSAPGYEDGTVLDSKNFIVDGGDGNDTIEIQKGGYAATDRWGNWATLRGGNGDDTLLGGDNGTCFEGGAGNDQIVGRLPQGKQWMDDLRYPGALHGVVVRLDLGEVQDDGFGGHDTVSGVADVTGTDFDDVIYAGIRNAWIYGGGGNDLLSVGNTYANLSGGDGDDTLLGGNERDQFHPGAGNDSVVGGGGGDHLIFYDNEDHMIHGATIRLDLQRVEDDGSGGVDVLSGIDSVTVYGRTDDVIYGNGNDNLLHGDDGADFIFGGAGDDKLQGGNGATLLGGSGNDYIPTDYRCTIINGGSGADTIEMWGYSDSEDHIITDSADRIVDHRDSRPAPDESSRPTCDVKPYTNPDPEDEVTQQRAQKKHKKHKRHHKFKKVKDMPIAARLFVR